ncbi:MAG: hypothetical protein Q8O42_22185 [Acidobacteriota bacterium]|nr:hypothetical protein [Acidobacteriota bacterium]
MINPKDPMACRTCALNRALIAKLDERLTALETEIRGAPVDVLLEEFDAAKARQDARQAAVAEYHRLQEEEFYRELPQLKAAAAERRMRFEAFMRERGFEP